MNANEVITNLALEFAGRPKGDYAFLDPIDHTNRSQSTNDTYPTSIKVALLFALTRLIDELRALEDSFSAKGREFAHVLKVGRTQLQDAVPMTVGQEFHGFASAIAKDVQLLGGASYVLGEINMGATAIGTGVNAPHGYKEAVLKHLNEITGLEMWTAPDLIEATSDTSGYVAFSGALKRAAVMLSKISNDLRLLSSGPQAGLGEINLPARQAGSSIMPGKVNPVIPEAMNQVAFSVVGADLTVTMAAEAGQLQLNAFEPIIAHSLLQSILWMARASRMLRIHCVDGITVNEDRLADTVARSVVVVTALTPFIGYAQAAKLAHQALARRESIADLVVASGLLGREEIDRLLAPDRLSGMTLDTAPEAGQTTQIPLPKK